MLHEVTGRVRCGDVDLAVRETGAGRPVLLLHGFAETGATWSPLAERLANQPLRLIAPDLRGHGESSRPRRVRDYRLDELVGDLECLVGELGGPVDVVAHDWGGALSWLLAERRPRLVRTATVIAAPHPQELRRAILRDRDQRRRSRYVLWAQLPVLPERVLGADDAARLRALFAATHSDDEIEAYCRAWRRPGALRSMVNWYRAVLRRPGRRASPTTPSRVPVLFITGAADPLFGSTVLDATVGRFAAVERVDLPGVGHSPHRESPERVAEHVIRHLGSSGVDR